MLSKAENERVTRVGPGTPMGLTLRRYWMPALLDWELPEPDCPPVRVRLLGEELVAFRDTDGRVGLAQAANDFPRLGQVALIGRLLQHCGIPKNNRRAKPRDLRVLQQMQTNLRPNPGGVAHRHGYYREAHFYASALIQAKRLAQHRLEGVGLAEEAEVVGVRGIGGALGVIANEKVAPKVVEVFHSIGFQLPENFLQCGVVVVVMILCG